MKLKVNVLGIFLTLPLLAQEVAPDPKHWANESEASVILVGGNSKSETYSAKQATSYEEGAHKVGIKGRYLMGKAASRMSAENWEGALRYDYGFSPTLGIFAGESISGDRFKNIHLQYDTDLGLKYTFWKVSDTDYALSEVGYRLTSYDFVSGQGKTTHYARLYAEVAKALNESVQAKLWAEFLPNVERTRKHLLNFEPSLKVSLNTVFSVKTGFLGRFDSEPTASKKFDYTYTLALIAKY